MLQDIVFHSHHTCCYILPGQTSWIQRLWVTNPTLTWLKSEVKSTTSVSVKCWRSSLLSLRNGEYCILEDKPLISHFKWYTSLRLLQHFLLSLHRSVWHTPTGQPDACVLSHAYFILNKKVLYRHVFCSGEWPHTAVKDFSSSEFLCENPSLTQCITRSVEDNGICTYKFCAKATRNASCRILMWEKYENLTVFWE